MLELASFTLPVPVPKSRIFCGEQPIGLQNSLSSSKMVCILCCMSNLSSSGSSLGKAYSACVGLPSDGGWVEDQVPN